MKRTLILWISVGFFVPIFWGFMAFLLFNMPEGIYSQIFWALVYVTCPPWLLGIPAIFTPVLNAILYGALAYSVLRLKVREVAQ